MGNGKVLAAMTEFMNAASQTVDSGTNFVDNIKEPIHDITHPKLKVNMGASTNDMLYLGAVLLGVFLIFKSITKGKVKL